MKKFNQFLCIAVLTLFSTVMYAQSTVTGKIIDGDLNSPLPGANIIVKGTTNGTTSNFEGNFTLNSDSNSGEVVISYVGYVSQTLAFNGDTDLGTITLMSSDVGLDEIMIVASVAVDRKTPVAVSTVKAADIQLKLGTQEFPEVLKSTPGVYATKAGGGFGDGRINLRGFSSENVAVMINGVPVNDMENGRVFWSNWAGLGDVTSTMQVQRGLGAARVAVPSIGGTINILTKTTDAEEGGNILTTLGNDGYTKFGVTYSTGLMDSGWAATVSAAKTDGDGYVRGTQFNAVSYFLNVSKEINDQHKISFTAFGAKQRHGQRQNRQTIETFRNNPDGIKYNQDWGYKNGQLTSIEDNFYHKPQISLNHYWDLSDKTSISTAAYVSFGSGGGGGTLGSDSEVTGFEEIADGRSKFTSDEYRIGNFGPLDFDRIVAENIANGANGSNAALRASRNDHNWYGVLSTLKTDLTDDMVLLAGLDFRDYTGIHFREVTDLLGGQFIINEDNVNNPTGVAREGDKIDYHNDGKVGWLGAFAQLEYDISEKFNTFIALNASNTSYKRIDYFQYTADDPLRETDRFNFFGFGAKGGGNYRIDNNHNVFVNLGYFEKAADFDAVFPEFNNEEINKNAENQKIISFELGYGFRGEKLSANVNLYRTAWRDRTETLGFQLNEEETAFANLLGVNAIHQGVEVDFVYRATDRLTLTGMASLGDWIWEDNIENVRIFDEEQEEIDDSPVNLHIAGLKVGDAAQTTMALGASYKFGVNTRITVDYNYFGNLYSDFNPSDRGVDVDETGLTPEEIQAEIDAILATDPIQPWEVPAYGVFDTAISHSFPFGNFEATLIARMNNVFNTHYIADALDGEDSSAQKALVYYGFGRTFSVGATIKF
ncbi:carboxypeptidase-like regulatory domain-containing protein [uncultured Winogradskyella sp.]|uniref:TonB-dependent receptor n=1 Tax=uncultured Winogradskyella sp. TaxID=395353 RepID=UPI00260FB98D|nr:carboxypeptidase-like regulatory domain-containing protein [uncultured Winogradskyella sp.]